MFSSHADLTSRCVGRTVSAAVLAVAAIGGPARGGSKASNGWRCLTGLSGATTSSLASLPNVLGCFVLRACFITSEALLGNFGGIVRNTGVSRGTASDLLFCTEDCDFDSELVVELCKSAMWPG